MMLSPTSAIDVQVEEARMDILHWLRMCWMWICQEGGFNGLEGWAVKEISGGASPHISFPPINKLIYHMTEIEVPLEDLIPPTSLATARKDLPKVIVRGIRPRGAASVTPSKVNPNAMLLHGQTTLSHPRIAKPLQREMEQCLKEISRGVSSYIFFTLSSIN